MQHHGFTLYFVAKPKVNVQNDRCAQTEIKVNNNPKNTNGHYDDDDAHWTGAFIISGFS